MLGSVALLGAGITAFYMTRLMIMTFFGERRWAEPRRRDYHPHESPPVMTVPMILLAVGSVVAGACSRIGGRAAELARPRPSGQHEQPEPHVRPAVLTIAHARRRRARRCCIAFWFIGRQPVPVTAPLPSPPVVARPARDLYGNAFNETLFMRPGHLARPGPGLRSTTAASTARSTASRPRSAACPAGVRRWQTGFVRSYALSMFAGALLVVACPAGW